MVFEPLMGLALIDNNNPLSQVCRVCFQHSMPVSFSKVAQSGFAITHTKSGASNNAKGSPQIISGIIAGKRITSNGHL